MEKPVILQRLSELEREINSLKAELEADKAEPGRSFSLQRVFKLIVSYWVLISFASVIATAVFVKFWYGIEFFESYRNVYINKTLSEFYRELGDRMMARSEWKSAEEIYQFALKINANNDKATYGLAKAQVFLPLPQEKYVAPELVDAKLEYLSKSFPKDSDVDFLKGVRYWDQRDIHNAVASFNEALKKNPKFAGGYLMLGYIKMNSFDIDGASKNFVKALELDPSNAVAANNLGFLFILRGNFSDAINYLSKSVRLSPRFLTGINLGDAYRYSGDYNMALQWHRHVLETINNLEGYERYAAGEWTYNFMPHFKGDKETIKKFINLHTVAEKKAIAHFALALDYALLSKFDLASEELGKALKLASGSRYSAFFLNKIAFIKQQAEITEGTKAWLNNAGRILAQQRF